MTAGEACRTVRVRVRRQEPGDAGRVFHDEYEVPCPPGTSVLDLLCWIKDHRDRTLAFRSSCRAGVCGACGVMADGRPVLACREPAGEPRLGALHIEPLADLSVQRDLIVDLDPHISSLTTVTSWLVPGEEAPEEGTHRQTPEQMAEYEDFSACLDCMLCQSACPQVDESSDFLGPAIVTAAVRYDADSRDEGAELRRDVLQSEQGFLSCAFDGSCTAVCPMGLDPAAAMQRAARGWR